MIVVLAMALIWLDSHAPWLQPLRQASGYLILPPQKVAAIPATMANWFGESAATHQELLNQTKQLTARNPNLETKAQRPAYLATDHI